jgi:hypothetical protein
MVKSIQKLGVTTCSMMKRKLLPLLGCLLLRGWSIAHGSETSAAHAGPAATNSFAIYLTAERVNPTLAGTNLAQVKLISPPVITDADIVAADFDVGLIRLRPECLKHLPQPSVKGTLFMAVVDGERLFVGAFWTGYSSFGPVADAEIQLEPLPRRDCLWVCWNDLVGGRGGKGWGGPWSDPHIKRCLGDLHKLGHVKTH